ncbi:MAG: sel1 repeat family protein [Hyphomicrobiales bacterium]|nr:sel1 repeat family protein [Hyphomicrobiales bacterium]
MTCGRMQMRKTNLLVRLCLLALCAAPGLAAAPALALDGTDTPASIKPVLPLYKNSLHALNQAIEGLRAGDAASSIDALKYAAAGGQSLAQWKLGRMYAAGEGVPHDDAKAYDYFLQIVNNYDEDTASRREIGIVASAYVAVGVYSLNGLPQIQLKPDVARAQELFHFAASTFGDPNAQYNLARIYLDASGSQRDPRQAAGWLYLAAEKNHTESQALLGNLLFTGQGVQKNRARGLMYLTVAVENAGEDPKNRWVAELREKALKVASDSERQAAGDMLVQYISRR